MTADSSAVSQAVVEVSGLGAYINKRWLLRGLDLHVDHGETLAVIGASGGGKSLMLRHVIGLNEPSEGTVDVLGIRLGHLNRSHMRQLGRRWGVLFQEGALFSALTVFDNIAFPIRELRRDGLYVPEAMVSDMVSIKLAAVGLEPDVANQMPDSLSGGMIKRAALARALALDPEVLFLDEPTAGLDPVSSNDFHQLYVNLHKDVGLSGLIVTHDRSTLASVADRVAVLVDGHIVTQGTLDEVRHVSHPFIERFFAADPVAGAQEA